jgi:hypothetical protein
MTDDDRHNTHLGCRTNDDWGGGGAADPMAEGLDPATMTGEGRGGASSGGAGADADRRPMDERGLGCGTGKLGTGGGEGGAPVGVGAHDGDGEVGGCEGGRGVIAKDQDLNIPGPR